MALERCAIVGLLLLSTAVLLGTAVSPALAQTYDYEQGQESSSFQQNEDVQASEFPGGEEQSTENQGEVGAMGESGQGFNQDPDPNQEPYPGADQEFGQKSDMATEPGQTDMANEPGDNQEAFGQTNPSENNPNENAPGNNSQNENVPGDNTQNEGGETSSSESAPGEPANPDATNPSGTTPDQTAPGDSVPEASAMEENSAGAALSPSSATSGTSYSAEYQDSWQKIKGGQVGPETIIGAAIGAVLGMSLCICCVCVCYIRQRNIARAQYGQPGGGAIEL